MRNFKDTGEKPSQKREEIPKQLVTKFFSRGKENESII